MPISEHTSTFAPRLHKAMQCGDLDIQLDVGKQAAAADAPCNISHQLDNSMMAFYSCL